MSYEAKRTLPVNRSDYQIKLPKPKTIVQCSHCGAPVQKGETCSYCGIAEKVENGGFDGQN